MRLSVIARQRVKRSVPSLLRLACVVALVGLGFFAFSMLYPRPLVIIFSMSIGHMIGMLAVALYLLAIVVDMVRSGSSVAPAAVEDSDSDDGTEDRAANPGDDSPPSSRS
jgi:hypothetical protein